MMELHPGGVAKMRCEAETDPNTPLYITWSHQGEVVPLPPFSVERAYVDKDRSLVLNLSLTTTVPAWLLGLYTCAADNGISSDEISVEIVGPDKKSLPTSDNVVKSIETELAEDGSSLGGFIQRSKGCLIHCALQAV